MQTRRLAVLVDGDNISASHAASVLSHAKRLGRADVARVYGAFNGLSDWQGTPGFRLMHAGAGKNAADLLLSIDAMELALINGIESFVIAASDRDYTHLAQRLRERGLHVLGLGEQKAPMAFRSACSEFTTLDGNTGSDKTTANGFTDFDQKIRSMIANNSKNGSGMRICLLSTKMRSAHGTKISTHPERTWRNYLRTRPTLYDVESKGPEAMVRFHPAGFHLRCASDLLTTRLTPP